MEEIVIEEISSSLEAEEERELSLLDFQNFMEGLETDFKQSCEKSNLEFVTKTLSIMAKFSVHNFCYMKDIDHASIIRYNSLYLCPKTHKCLLVMELFDHPSLAEMSWVDEEVDGF